MRRTESRVRFEPLAYVIDTKATGMMIRMQRKSAGFSAQDVADLLGLASTQSIYLWEEGRSLPSIDNLIVLSKVLKTPIDRFLIAERKG